MNFAKTYAKNVLERFANTSTTRGVLSDEYKFNADSGKSITVLSMSTATMHDYSRTGTNRYGTPEDLETSAQELLCTKERSFAFVIDGLNNLDAGGIMEAGKALRRQLDEVITPEIDAYTVGVLAAKAVESGNKVATAPTKDNAYSLFLDCQIMLDKAKAPRQNRVAWVSSEYYKYIKLDPSFIKSSEIANEAVLNGQVGMIDGVPVILANYGDLPTNTHLVLAHKSAAVQPFRLEQFVTHINPPGINGALCEGLVVYDAIVLDQRKKAIAVIDTTG